MSAMDDSLCFSQLQLNLYSAPYQQQIAMHILYITEHMRSTTSLQVDVVSM